MLLLVMLKGGRHLKPAVLVCCIALLAFHGLSHGVEPSTKPEETTRPTELPRPEAEGAPLPFPEQMVVGTVTDASGGPLGGVTVKLFADGKLVEIGHSSSAGSYEMRLPLNVEKDETVVMWFVPGTGDLMPQMVVLKKSSVASDNNLFSQCAVEVRMRSQTRVDVRLVNESELISSLKTKGCL